MPPQGQPGLWCEWYPKNNSTIIGPEESKFYHSSQWIKYLIKHFIGENPLGKVDLPFLQSHWCNGQFEVQGKDPNDCWTIVISNNNAYFIIGERND